MSWQDPKGPWAKAIRWRIVNAWLPFVLTVMGMVGAGIVIYKLIGLQVRLLWMTAAVSAFVLLISLWKARVELSILRLVPRH